MAKICINPGHGENYHGALDPGACYKNLRECDIALKAAFKLKALLEAAGHIIIMTRTGNDMSTNITNDVLICNENHCDLFISIHVNATPAGTGIETWCMFGSEKSVSLANSIQSNLISVTRQSDRGVQDATNRYGPDKPIYVCKWTTPEAVLVELMFIDNEHDYELLLQDSFQQQCAVGLYNGIQQYLGLPILNIEEEKKKMKNLVIYGEGPDKRAAEYLADHLKCPIVSKDNLTQDTIDAAENVYMVGGSTKPVEKVIIISGANRYETMANVLRAIANGGKV